MAKKFPVGTIRDWQGGTVIKAHEPIHPYSSGWITLKTSAKFDGIGKECDRNASVMVPIKVPLNGEKILDHEINEFGEKQGGGSFYASDNFKKYEGFYGAGRYSFRNEFSRMFMHNDMAMDEYVNNMLVEANEEKGGDEKTDKLTAEEKKEIRLKARQEYKEKPSIITEAKALQLLEIVKRTKTQVEEGLEFKDPEKKLVYEDFLKRADALPEPYELISIKRQKKLEAVDLIETTFSDNWGVQEACKEYIQKKFDEYVRKYADQIAKDSLEEQMRMFGVTVDMEPDEFYSKIYEKAINHRYDFLEKYVGKEIIIIDEKPVRVKLWRGEDNIIYFKDKYGDTENLIESLKEGGGYSLSPDYDEFGGGFKDLIYLRFQKRYGKSVDGKWTLEHLPAIQNLENILLELPAGHFKTNEHLDLITNQSYNGGDRGGYAWYSPEENRINLSADCIHRSNVWGVLANPIEFKSVMLHEIGHAVDRKIGGAQTYGYKKFVVDCGWSYASPELKAKMSATGEEKDIPRSGSNATVSLITPYAAKSPSEAFAEYYSFYNLNRETIDKYFDTKDRRHLQTSGKIIAKSVSSEQIIHQMIPHKTHPEPELWGKYKETRDHLSEKGREQKITLHSPWGVRLSKEEKRKFSFSAVGERKNYSINSMPPIITVRDGLNRVAIDGGVRVEVAKMNRQLIPAIEISKEHYSALKGQGLTDEQISMCVYTDNVNQFVPKQIAPAVEIRGLIYRDELIPIETILENHNVLKSMSDICGSKELQKAIEEMFAHD